MSAHEHHHSYGDGESKPLESKGLKSMVPPPWQLSASPVDPPGEGLTSGDHAPLQLQEGDQSQPTEGFSPLEALGVARDAPAKGEEKEDSGGVYLRSTPASGDESTIITRIPYQTQFFIQAQNATWYKVRTLEGEEGFVAKHLVSVNGAGTMGFTVHLIQSGETAQGIAGKYFNGDDGRAEFKVNTLDYAKAIWAYNTQHYGKEVGIASSGEQIYSLSEGVTIWIPSTDWAYRYVKDLPRDERHGDSWARWVYEFVTYDNAVVGSVREHLQALAEEWDPANAQAVMEVIKGHLQSGRDTMVTAMESNPVLTAVIGPAGPVLANFAVSFVVGALDQAKNSPPEVLQQVLKSYLTAAIDPEFNIGLVEGVLNGIGNWFSDIGEAIQMIGQFVGAVGKIAFSKDTYTEDIPQLANAIAEALPDLAQFIQEIELSEVLAAMHGTAASMGEQMGAGAFSQLLGHLGNSPFGQGFSSGKIMGYLIPEIALAVGTEGIGTVLKNALTGLRPILKGAKLVGKAAINAIKRIGPFLDDLMKVAQKLVESGKAAASSFGQKLLDLLKKLKRIATRGAKNPLSRYLDGGIGFDSFYKFKKEYGAAGGGQAWHHIVEQHADNISKFGAQNIHNTKNLIKLPHGKGTIHNRISGYYSSKQFFSQGKTVREWLKAQSYDDQFEFGIRKLKEFGWTGDL